MNKNDTVSDNVSNKCDNVSSNPKTTTTEEKLTLKQNIPEKIVSSKFIMYLILSLIHYHFL